MNLISDILFWISNGLLVPVVVLLIVLFIRSLLLIGSFFGQYLAIRRTDALLRQQLDALTIDTLPELESKLPVKSNSLVIVYIRRVLGSKDRPAHVLWWDFLLVISLLWHTICKSLLLQL